MPRKTKGRIYKRGKRWYLDYQANGQRVRTALRDQDGNPVANRKDAETAADIELRPVLARDTAERRRLVSDALRSAEDEAREAERAAGERREREEAEARKLPVAEAWERFPYTEATRGAVTRPLSPRTARDNASHWRVFAAWAEARGIGAVEDIEPEHVTDFSRDLRDRMTANRHNKIMFTCSVICRQSGRPDPFANAKRYRTEPVHRENLEPADVRRVIGAATGELRRLFILATFTGLRLKDCATLQWSDVHLGEDGGRIIRRMAKTGKTVRFPLHSELRAELESTPARQRSGAVCPELAETYQRDSARLSKLTRQVFEGCGLATLAEGKAGRASTASLRGFHSFRHTFATECARAGVPLGLVKEWLGHSSPEITRIYENWSMDRDAGRVLDALPSLALPEGSEGTPAVKIEAERERLASLAGTLPLAKVRELLAMIGAGVDA